MSYLRFVTKHRPTVIPDPAPCEAGYSTNSNPSVFLVSDANPFTGTHHVRANMLSGTRMMTFDTEQDCPEIVGYCAIGAEAEIGASGVVDFDSFSVVVTPA